MTILRHVDPPEDVATVHFDYDDNDGSSNPEALETFLVDFALDAPPLDVVTFESVFLPGGQTLRSRDELTLSSIRFMAEWRTIGYDAAARAVGELSRLLRKGGTLHWAPDVETNFIDFEPSPAVAILRGQDRALHKALNLLQDPDGLPVVVRRQPYLRLPEIDSDVNLLPDALMIVDSDLNGVPDHWATDGSAPSIAGAWWRVTLDADEYVWGIAIPSPVSGGASAAVTAGLDYTFSVYARVTSGSRASDLVINWYNAAGSQIGSVEGGDFTATTTEQRAVFTATAPALAAYARVHVHNEGAGTSTYELRRAQFEQAASVSDFRVGSETVPNDPATGRRCLPIVLSGNAETEVITEAKMDTGAAVTDAYYAVVQALDEDLAAEFINERHVFQLDDFTLDHGVAVADADASEGTAVDPLSTGGIIQSVVANGNSNSAAASWPAPTKQGNHLRAFIAIDDDPTSQFTEPAGAWTLDDEAEIHRTVPDFTLALFWLNGAAAQSGSQAFPLTTTRNWVLILVEYDATTIEPAGVGEGGISYGSRNTAGSIDPGVPEQDAMIRAGVSVGDSALSVSNSSDNPDYVQVQSGTQSPTRMLLARTADPLSTTRSSSERSLTVTGSDMGLVERLRVRTGGLVKYGRLELTTKLASLTGRWTAHLRGKPSTAGKFPLALGWAPNDQEPISNLLPTVEPDSSPAITHDFTDVELGSFEVPEDLSALALEVYHGFAADAGAVFRADFLELRRDLTKVSAPLRPIASYLGRDLVTPTSYSGTVTAGTLDALPSNDVRLISTNNGVGTPPSVGTEYQPGRMRAVASLSYENADAASKLEVRVRNVTDGVDVPDVTVVFQEGESVVVGYQTFSSGGTYPGGSFQGGPGTQYGYTPITDRIEPIVLGSSRTNIQLVIEWDAVAGKKYQVQVVKTGGTATYVIHGIAVSARPFAAATNIVRTKPGSHKAELLDSSRNVLQPWSPGGSVPFRLVPGKDEIHVMQFAWGDTPIKGYVLPVSDNDRDPVVRVRFAPRRYA